MTPRAQLTLATLALAAFGLGACSNTSTPTLATASVAPQPAAAPKFDAACMALASQIDNLKAEGSIERLEKAAAGKGSNVQVKRTSLAKQAELNKANSDFQTRCGPPMPKAQTAAVVPPTAAATSSTAAAAPSSVTPTTTAAAVAPPSAAVAPRN